MLGFPLAEQYVAPARKGYFQACLDLLFGEDAKIGPEALQVRIGRLSSRRVETPAVAVRSSPQHDDAELIEYLAAIDNAWRRQRPRVRGSGFDCEAQDRTGHSLARGIVATGSGRLARKSSKPVGADDRVYAAGPATSSEGAPAAA